MASLIYSAIASLDGYIADEDGRFDWAEPDEEVHSFINDLERSVGTICSDAGCTRCWRTGTIRRPSRAAVRVQEFAAIWQAADKVVFSRTLETAQAGRTRIERDFDPQAVRRRNRSRIAISPSGSRSRRSGDQGRVGRRLPDVRRAGRRRSGQAGSAARCPPRARIAGRTPIPQWHGVSSLPHPDAMMEGARYRGPQLWDDGLRALACADHVGGVRRQVRQYSALLRGIQGRSFMRRIITAVVAMLTLVLAGSAGAIATASLTGTGIRMSARCSRPGLSDGTWVTCSGTLISPTVFLTAAHCDWGLQRLAVTFDSVYDAETGKEYWGTWHADPRYTGARTIRTTSRWSFSTSP